MPDQYMNGGMASEQVTKKWLELQARAPQVVEQQRKAFAEGSSALDTLRCYAVLGHEVGQHTVLEPNFWARLSGLLHNAGEGQVHYFQHGSRRGASAQSGSLVGSNVVAALPGGDYAIVLAVSFDVHSQTYAVLHMPSEADSAVFSAQHALNGTSDPGAGPVWRSGEGFFADGSPVPTPRPRPVRRPSRRRARSGSPVRALRCLSVSLSLSLSLSLSPEGAAAAKSALPPTARGKRGSALPCNAAVLPRLRQRRQHTQSVRAVPSFEGLPAPPVVMPPPFVVRETEDEASHATCCSGGERSASLRASRRHRRR